MIKKMLFAAALTGLVAGATPSAPGDAGRGRSSGCLKAAKAKFPGDLKARRCLSQGMQGPLEGLQTAQKAAKKAA